jgi:HIV Tat-specific factor 1
MSILYFYTLQNGDKLERSGPISKDGFESLLSAGYVNSSTLVWSPGFSDWIQLSACAELSSLLFEKPTTENNPKNNNLKERDSKKRPRNVTREEKTKTLSTSSWITITDLPIDVTLNEIVVHFKKAGIIQIDIVTGDPKVILHRVRQEKKDNDVGIKQTEKEDTLFVNKSSNSNTLSRTASICYLKHESVDLAVQLLDGAELRPGNGGFSLHVSPSTAVNEFGEFVDDESLLLEESGVDQLARSTSRKKRQQDIKGEALASKARNLDPKARAALFRSLEQKLKLGWADEGTDDSTGLCIVVLRNMFTIDEVQHQEGFLQELREDVIHELEESCGTVTTAIIYERHPEGIVFVKFETPGAAALCIDKMNGRYFGGKKILCGYWDGVEEFKEKEDEVDAVKREEEFGKWLDSHK